MQKHNLVQGSPSWHEYRANHFNASDAPAMLGISQYKTRSQLLQEMATGISQEFDAATERRFADGHRFEALARPVAEGIVGADLYPITASEGKLSASFDGMTLDESACFEHKSLNAALRSVEFSDGGRELPEEYRAQMEQQLMISGAHYCLFMASKWDSDDLLVEERHCRYLPDQAMRDRIVQGWVQFSKDLENYEHIEAIPVAVATPIRDLPVITYQMNGMAVLTNLHADVRPAIVALVEKSKQPLETDQDFADLDLLCKHFAAAEDQCQLIAAQVDAEFKDTDKFKKDLKELQELMAAARIAGKKRVTTEKESRKLKIISDARTLYVAYVATLEAEIKPITLNLALPDFALAIKGMAKLDNMKSKCSDLVASGKSAADAAAKDYREKLAWCKDNAAGHSALFPDLQQIITKPMDDFTLLITSRIDKHKAEEAEKAAALIAKIDAENAAKLEAERETIRIQEEAKARAKVEAEQRAAAEAERGRIAEITRLEQEAAETQRAVDAAAQREHEKVLAGEPAVIQPAGDIFAPENKQSASVVGLIKKPSRPAHDELIQFVANNFNVSYDQACTWVIETAESLKVAA